MTDFNISEQTISVNKKLRPGLRRACHILAARDLQAGSVSDNVAGAVFQACYPVIIEQT